MSKRLTYLPKLDGLRALAALMVLVTHYIEDLDLPFSFTYGGYGVQIFFVISGFLITSILLNQKASSDSSKLRMIFHFVIKRALRLFPVYYLMLFILFSLNKIANIWICEPGKEWYYFAYLQNLLFYNIGFQSTLLNHTWSLAVEEQFYLFWPFFIFYIPKKQEFNSIILIILTGFLTRYYLTNFYSGAGTYKGVTFMQFDTLGAGALLAYTLFYQKTRIINFLEKYSVAIFCGSLALSYYFMCKNLGKDFLLPLLVTIMAVNIVFICASQKKYIFEGLLMFQPLAYLGKISYGIYLYHKPIPLLFGLFQKHLNIHFTANKFFLFLIYLSITILIASLSWRLIEKPISRVKERFDI